MSSNINTRRDVKILVNYKRVDYRGFVFVVHPKHGFLLLRCTRKKQKQSHFQIPGGRIDTREFVNAAKVSKEDANSQLEMASRMGAARELWEETGIDVRNDLNRLECAKLRAFSSSNVWLQNEYKERLFYFLFVTDEDFFSFQQQKQFPGRFSTPMTKDESIQHLMLRLSVEHSGFDFEKDAMVAAEKLRLHSGARISQALMMAMKYKQL